jgi:hypothetical protein
MLAIIKLNKRGEFFHNNTGVVLSRNIIVEGLIISTGFGAFSLRDGTSTRVEQWASCVSLGFLFNFWELKRHADAK